MSIPRPEHPKPQFERKDWINLNGQWSCEFDFGNSGFNRKLENSTGFTQSITVPFCPESELSGIGHKDFIEYMWYHRKISIPTDWQDKRILLHFGAVDYECEVFIDGQSVGKHYGGSSSFKLNITKHIKTGQEHNLVVWVKDLLRSGEQTTGKQCAHFKSQGCSYTRVTGIWQTVWLEAVSPFGLETCRITPDLDNQSFIFTPTYFGLSGGNKLKISIFDNEKLVAEKTSTTTDGVPIPATLPSVKLWEPGNPHLYDITFEVLNADNQVIDKITSYAGMRKIHIEGNTIFLNNKKLFQRLVLDQGYYPDGIWTAPTDQALKQDIEISMAAGFNGARLHQKVFEERFHYWADKLGYLTWGESASWGISFWANRGVTTGNHAASFRNFQNEWREIVERDANHPSIIAWTPLNETRGMENLKEHYRIQTEIYDITKQIDPTRPVNDASGYVHVKTDLWTVHVYQKDVEDLKAALQPEDGSVFRNYPENEVDYEGQPYLNDEFGGFMYIPPEKRKFADNTWGYHGLDLQNEDELCKKIREQVNFMLEMENMAGYCYTQLTDVEQEQNGIYNYDRTPKCDISKIAAIFGKDRI